MKNKIVSFATHMRNYPDGIVPQLLHTLVTALLPRALATLERRRQFLEHLGCMLEFGGCTFQRRCVYYALPICAWCEYRSPYYPPGYVYPLVATPDDPPSWENPCVYHWATDVANWISDE